MQHIEGEFTGTGNFKLYYQGWLPAEKPKALLLIVHGLAEHSGRYYNLADYFVSRGYAVYSFDHRGCGKSQGDRGYVESFSHFVDDLGIFLKFIRNQYNNLKVFIIGHSVGGTVAASYAANRQDGFEGLILSAPTIKAGAGVPRGVILAARLFSRLFPRLGLYVIDAKAISRDRKVIDSYVNDPLVYRGKITIQLGIGIMTAMQALPSQMPDIGLPVLLLHGTADKLSDPRGSELIYNRISSPDKTLKMYDGLFHEIFNEPESQMVFEDMEEWLAARI